MACFVEHFDLFFPLDPIGRALSTAAVRFSAAPSTSSFTSSFGASGIFNFCHVAPPIKDPLAEFGQYLVRVMPKYVQASSLARGELTVHVAPEGVIPVMTYGS